MVVPGPGEEAGDVPSQDFENHAGAEQKSLNGDPGSSAASVRKQGVRSRASNASYPALKRVRNQLGESDNESGDSGTSSDSSSDE